MAGARAAESFYVNRNRLRARFDHDGRSVREHFGDARGDFVGVVPHRDDGVRAVLCGVLEQQLVRILARFFAQLRVERDVAADERLQSGADVADDAARPHDDAAHDPEIPDDAISRQLVSRRDHRRVQTVHRSPPRRPVYCGRRNNPPYTAFASTWPCIAFMTFARVSNASAVGSTVIVVSSAYSSNM